MLDILDVKFPAPFSLLIFVELSDCFFIEVPDTIGLFCTSRDGYLFFTSLLFASYFCDIVCISVLSRGSVESDGSTLGGYFPSYRGGLKVPNWDLLCSPLSDYKVRSFILKLMFDGESALNKFPNFITVKSITFPKSPLLWDLLLGWSLSRSSYVIVEVLALVIPFWKKSASENLVMLAFAFECLFEVGTVREGC